MNDKDEFINKKNLLQEFANEIYKFDSVDGEFQRGVDWALRMIIKHPTTDAEEVRHGEWEVRHRHEHYPSGKPYEENICPFCKRADHNGDGLYCGYCGAKMDKDKEE